MATTTDRSGANPITPYLWGLVWHQEYVRVPTPDLKVWHATIEAQQARIAELEHQLKELTNERPIHE